MSVSEEAAPVVAAAHSGAGEELALYKAFAAAGVAVKVPAVASWARCYVNGVVSQINLV